MTQMHDKARALLESGEVKVVIGYVAGSAPDRARAEFVRSAEKVNQLIFDERCVQNLAVYLLKAEVKALGKPAVIAKMPALRTILQLAAENQIKDGDLIALAADADFAELRTFAEIEQHLAESNQSDTSDKSDKASKVQQFWAMSREERWAFWTEQFAGCLKCYACRAACPLCYCSRCVVEANQPQWVSVAPHPVGNIEWHVVRAMHLAGRCIGCGYCVEACPVGIPLNLLAQMLRDEVQAEFGMEAGVSASADYALSSFKPEDKEAFIR